MVIVDQSKIRTTSIDAMFPATVTVPVHPLNVAAATPSATSLAHRCMLSECESFNFMAFRLSVSNIIQYPV
jgi:hypothetical protein